MKSDSTVISTQAPHGGAASVRFVTEEYRR
jgi:hypothetical protein